jgi:hypothetical protein
VAHGYGPANNAISPVLGIFGKFFSMLGAIIGDIVVSRFEFVNHRSKQFELFTPGCFFTDDTVCTIAVADWILRSRYEKCFRLPPSFNPGASAILDAATAAALPAGLRTRYPTTALAMERECVSLR